MHELRTEGISADMDYKQRKLKAQMKDADRKRAQYVIVLGDQEFETGQVELKNMQNGETQTVQISELVKYLED